VGGRVHTIKKNKEALVVTSKETGPEVNAEKTSVHGTISHKDRNAGQKHNIKICNKSCERMEQFKYLRTTLMNQNSIQEENENRLMGILAVIWCRILCL